MEATVIFNRTPSLELLWRGDRCSKLGSSVWSVTVVYLGGLLLVKRVAALEGETVCTAFIRTT